MTEQVRISENEAVQIAGVSARTLLRFSESGYLTVEVADDGVRYYSTSQLTEIFGVPMDRSVENTTEVENSASWACSVEAAGECLKGGDTPSSEAPTGEPTLETPQPHPSPEIEVTETATEIQRLKNLLSMQERILDARDDEIADLRSQRTWLRERIEKLEEKSDRDQILLLSETQTIRQLISYRESRKSVVQTFLEWIGIAPTKEIATLPSATDYSQKAAQAAGSRTIEVRAAANNE
jgi:DNA-binding transcriptional MerR regulator